MSLTFSPRPQKGRKPRTRSASGPGAAFSQERPLFAIERQSEAAAAIGRTESEVLERGRRQSVFREGGSAGHIYEIIEGGVIVFKTMGDGRRQIFDILGPGALIGSAAGASYRYSAECLTKCRFLKYSSGDVAGSQSLQKRLAQQLLSMIESLQEHALLLGRRTAMERIAYFLLNLPDLSVRLGRQPGEAMVQTAMKQRDIGDYLGLKVETVSRNLAILKRQTIIATGKRGQFLLLDMAALQRMVES